MYNDQERSIMSDARPGVHLRARGERRINVKHIFVIKEE
jgi:hypothetical protein